MLVIYMLISNCQGSVTLVWRHSWFYDRALILPSCSVFMWAHSFECARAVRSLVCVPCFMLERGVWIPALMSWVSVSCRGSGTRAPRSVSLWECAVSSSLDCVLFCPRVFCCVACSLCFYRLRAFMLYLVLCGTQLVYFIGCVLSCCHVLCEHMAYEFSH